MNVLVTGGTGFVGSHLVEQLCKDGMNVRALARSEKGEGLVRSLGATPVRGDLEDVATLRHAAANCDVVFHCAARVEIHGTESDFQKTTIAGTARLIGIARESGVRRFVQVSSCGIYPPALLRAGMVIDEQTPVPQPPKWFAYARAKYAAEQMVQRECAPPMEWTIVRLGYVYGPRNRTMKTYLEPALKDAMMMIIGKGDNELALIYVEDAARAIMLAGQRKEAAGAILIAAPTQRRTQLEYFNALADGFGVPRTKKRINYHVAMFWGCIGEKFVKSGHRQAMMRRAAIALNGLPQRIDCSRTRELLGWEPSFSMEEGMRRAFDWYRAEFPNTQ